MSKVKKVNPNKSETQTIIRALSVHRHRVQLTAALETGCPRKARALTRYVIRQTARQFGAQSLSKGTSRILIRQVTKMADRLRRQGALA